jgi:glycosyltransferase 2 family protein
MGEEARLRGGWVRWARGLFALAMVAVLARVLMRGASDIVWADGIGLRLGAAALLGVGGLLAAAKGWASIIGTTWGPGIATMGATLPLRHLPLGGFGQMVGMSGLAQAAKTGKASLSYSTPLFLAATAGGASLVALPVVWQPRTPLWMRVLIALAVAGTLLTAWRGDRVLRAVLSRFNRSLPRGETPMVIPLLWSALAALAMSTAFTVLFPASGSLVAGISSFAASWLCGFLFVIAPAGLGVREGALVALWPEVEPATVVAAGVIHRFSTLIAEAVLFILAWRLSRDISGRDKVGSADEAAVESGEGG